MTDYPVRAVTVSAHLSLPSEDVFKFIADTRNDPLWCPNVDTAELVAGDGVEVGSRFTFHQHLDRGQKRLEFDGEVEVVALADRSIHWIVSDRFQVREIELAVESEGDGSRITQTTRARFRKPPGMAKWAYPFIAKRTFKDQFSKLEDYLSNED